MPSFDFFLYDSGKPGAVPTCHQFQHQIMVVTVGAINKDVNNLYKRRQEDRRRSPLT